jgi:hypothetical protein
MTNHEAETLAVLAELAGQIAALGLDLDVEPPEPDEDLEDIESAAEYAEGLIDAVEHIRHQVLD